MNKKFSLRDILTVTTGRLLTKSKGPRDNGIDDLYKILEHMTGEAPFTHVLGRFADECKPMLLHDYPELKNADLDQLDAMLKDGDPSKAISDFISRCVTEWGMMEEYSIGKIPRGDHVSKHPIQEFQEMMSK